MKITILTLMLCLFCAVTLHAQGLYTVKGSVIDSTSNTPLINTTICVLNAKDSTLRKFTRAATNGSFTINNIGKGKFILMVTYPNYADYIEQFSLDSVNTIHNFGKVNLQLKSKLLQDVIIKGTAALIKIKGDTTEFNAAALQIQPNSKVEDLLKQLPGIQVDKDGKITAQGQPVPKVLVDGEEFFGDDPTLVTKNIRADMVDKIQLYDKKSDQATFTGIDDGEKTKTINIKLKEDKKNGYFGKLDGDAGTRNFYQGQAMYNQFQGKKKFSAYGIAANTGKVGLGWDDANKYGSNAVQLTDDGGIIISSSGSGGDLDSFGGQYDGRGIPVARAGGAHFDDKWNSDKQSVNMNYKIGSLGVEGDTKTFTQNNLPKGFTTNNSDQSYNNNIFRQKLDVTYTTKLDTTSDLKLYIDGTGKETKTNNNNYTTSTDSLNALINTNTRTLTNDVKSEVFNASAFYTKKFKKTGRTLSVLVSENVNNSDADGYLNSKTTFYNSNGTTKDSIINQHKINKLRSSAFGSNITYTEPFSKKLSLVLNYGISLNHSSANRQSFNRDTANLYKDLDPLFSNNYEFNQLANQGGAILNYHTAKTTVNFGTKATDVNYTQTDLYTNNVFRRSFLNWSPQATYQYKFSQQQTLRISYNGSTRQPSIDQIQPIASNNDPLNIIKGNPDLKPSFTNRLNAYYNSYKVLSDQSFYISGNYSFTSNQIVSNQTYDSLNVSTTRYQNLNGHMPHNYSVYTSLSKKMRWLANFSVGLSGNTDGGVSYGSVNNVLNTTSWQNYSASLTLSKYMANKYDIYLSYGPNYSFNKTSLQPKLPNNGGGSTGNIYLNFYLPGKVQIGSDGTYQFKEKTRVADAYQTFIVNSYISKKFLKSEGLKLTLSGNDILNQNLGINRSTFSTSTYSTIKRYFLFSITWDFSKMGGAPEPKK